MSDEDPRDLRDLLGDAVADVEPRDRLGEIRRRTARPAHHRRWPLIVLGAGTATAAVVSAVAVLGDLGANPEEDAPATRPAPEQAAVATYFIGRDDGRLYREFQSVPASEPEELALAALRRLEADAGPLDPDYGTDWPDGSFLGVAVSDDTIVVEVSERTGALPETWRSLQGLVDTAPSLQQVVHTAQASIGRLAPVRFESGGLVPDSLLGGPVDPILRRDSARAAPVNISDPAEGHEVDDKLTLRGVVAPNAKARSLVRWELRAPDASVVASGAIPVVGTAWEATVGITDVPSGTYELVATLPGAVDGPCTDTRTIVVR